MRGVRPVFEPAHHEAQPAQRPEPGDTPRPKRAVELPDTAPPGEEEAERDLSAELKKRVGIPLDCVQDFTAPRPTQIRIGVTAVVRPTGIVITPSAYGMGLSSAARQCIERRVGTVVLEPLGEPVSERISTVIEIDYEPETIVESEPGVPEPRLRDVQEPLPKRPDIPPSGVPIQAQTSKWISGGFDGGRPPEGPAPRKVEGPKPRPIDGYDVDQNAQVWR